MEIKPATAMDAAEITRIWNHEIRDGLVTFASLEKTPQDVVDIINERRRQGFGFLICRVDDRLAGFASYSQFRNGNGYAKTMEHTIILDKFAHGKGIGRAMMNNLETHARDFGAHSMFAGVSAENAAGIAFHTSIGYKEAARLPEVGYKFNRWLDLVLMQKFL